MRPSQFVSCVHLSYLIRFVVSLLITIDPQSDYDRLRAWRRHVACSNHWRFAGASDFLRGFVRARFCDCNSISVLNAEPSSLHRAQSEILRRVRSDDSHQIPRWSLNVQLRDANRHDDWSSRRSDLASATRKRRVWFEFFVETRTFASRTLMTKFVTAARDESNDFDFTIVTIHCGTTGWVSAASSWRGPWRLFGWTAT